MNELPVGHYRLEIAARGFAKYIQEGISLDVNQTAMVLVHLQVGSEAQQVDVKADAALVQNTVSSMGETVMQREILDLPLDGRDFSQLGVPQPGVVPLTPGCSKLEDRRVRTKATRLMASARSRTTSSLTEQTT